ncbi:unnamed protein product, partial [marine sediment metagenome]
VGAIAGGNTENGINSIIHTYPVNPLNPATAV